MKTRAITTRELLLMWPAPLMVPEDTDSVGVEIPLEAGHGGWVEILVVGNPMFLGTHENGDLGTRSLYFRLRPGEGVYARHGDALGGQGERRTLGRQGFFCPA